MLKNNLKRILNSSYPLPNIQTVEANIENDSVGFGGVFPKHFQRKNSIYKSKIGTLIFYGELYNDAGISNEAEYALKFIQEHGIEKIYQLDGPFALFFWNEEQKCLIAATDRLGRFPIYYSRTSEGIYITTDLHSLFTSKMIIPNLRKKSIVDFLTIGFVTGDESIFEGIKRITAGEYLSCSFDNVEKRKYWKPQYSNLIHDTEEMVHAFEKCTCRAIDFRPNSVVALSGGWDSRATVAALKKSNANFTIMTFGEFESTDVNIARSIAQKLNLNHEIISPEQDFFDGFNTLAQKTISLGSGHTTVDIAFQLYAFERLAKKYSMVLDSAGCEFRRGLRAKLASQNAKKTSDITDYLTTMYSTGVWNDEIINKDFFEDNKQQTHHHLTTMLDDSSATSFEEQIDLFTWDELWCHHYAHGYPLQTNIIGCHMPYSDNMFYDLFLQSDTSIRWTYQFHENVINKNYSLLKTFPISHGNIKIPYGNSRLKYVPIVYHRIISKMSSLPALHWVKTLDNYRPFRSYNKWYTQQLEQHVIQMLRSSFGESQSFISINKALELIEIQKQSLTDRSHSISILMTLAHLMKYIKNF